MSVNIFFYRRIKMAETNYVNFNGINKNMVHERTNQKTGEKFYSVGIKVPNDVSRNGIANVITKKVFPTKSDPENKVNIGFPETWKVNISVASFYNKEKPEETKYKTIEIPVTELKEKNIEALKAAKDRMEAKESEQEAEAEGPELD